MHRSEACTALCALNSSAGQTRTPARRSAARTVEMWSPGRVGMLCPAPGRDTSSDSRSCRRRPSDRHTTSTIVGTITASTQASRQPKTTRTMAPASSPADDRQSQALTGLSGWTLDANCCGSSRNELPNFLASSCTDATSTYCAPVNLETWLLNPDNSGLTMVVRRAWPLPPSTSAHRLPRSEASSGRRRTRSGSPMCLRGR